MSTENQVHLVGDFRREELKAAAAVSPGNLLEITSAGKFQKHSTAGGACLRIFAEIDALQGETLDDDYSTDDLVSANVEVPGNEVQAFLKAGENVAIGAELESAGDGTLQALTTGKVVAVAREAEDLSGSGAVATLIQVMLV